MNKQFQNYSKTRYFGLQVEAGFAIVPTDCEVGLAESIFWNNFVNSINLAVLSRLRILRQAQDDNYGGRQLGKE